MKNGQRMFEFEDTLGQIFTAQLNGSNLYSLSDSLHVFVVMQQSQTTATIEFLKKRKAETMKIWQRRLSHLNENDLVRMSKNLWIEVKIKDCERFFFCEACKLANIKKRLFKLLMRRFNKREDKLSMNIDGDDDTLDKSDEQSSFFQDFKYFLMITNDVMRMRWVFFLKSRVSSWLFQLFLNLLRLRIFLTTRRISFTLKIRLNSDSISSNSSLFSRIIKSHERYNFQSFGRGTSFESFSIAQDIKTTRSVSKELCFRRKYSSRERIEEKR